MSHVPDEGRGSVTQAFTPVPPQASGGQTFLPAGGPGPGGPFQPAPVPPPVAPAVAGQPAYYVPAQAGPPAPVVAPAPPAAEPPRPPARAAAPARDRAARSGLGQESQEGDIQLDSALIAMIEAGASDLHLTVGSPPMIRSHGALKALDGFESIRPDGLRRSIYSILTQRQRETFEANLELDFAYAVRGKARFRVNLYQQRESIGAAFRVIPYEIKPLEDLGVPPVVSSFAGLPRGLVLVTGPTGSGKSTTLAAVIDLANRTRADHIMTVEDPIEFLHRHKKSLINQREVGADTHSFANALKHVLRQDPDIILVGEMRDLETISVALTAAETGHLVFATLHTQDAAQTIDRVIDVFPAEQQSQVRTQLASAIQGVVCQTLCKKANGTGRAVATEVMVATPAIRNLIREGKTHQIYSAMQAGADHGMYTMDQHLADLVKKGTITYEVGVEKCHHIEDFNKLVGRTARTNQGASTLNSGTMGYSPAGNGMR
ncbi:type IV pilus twitching motility protein PilT [Cellulomonas xylanilytica]|nr:type IV pilus twitching motility protein PilT [Cellulomonas xylanilytica]